MKKISSTKADLQEILCLDSDDEWVRWLRSNMLKPYWIELWEDFFKHRQSTECDPCLMAVQERIIDGEACGRMTFSEPQRDKTDWDVTDHYACFLYWVKWYNTRSNQGVFWNRDMTDEEMDCIIWALKDYLVYIHSPSHIMEPTGGNSIFGTERQSTSKFIYGL